MVYSIHHKRLWSAMISVFFMMVILTGCGGGGGNGGVPGLIQDIESSGVTNADAPSIDESGSLPGVKASPRQPGNRSVKLNTYNLWHLKDNSGLPIDKLIEMVAYRDVITYSERWDAVEPRINEKILAANPAARCYRIYTLCVKSAYDSDWKNPSNQQNMIFPIPKAVLDKNDWWLRDGDGNIVKESDTVWFVDVGKPGLKEAYLEAVKTKLDGKRFEGLTLDYWCPVITRSYLGHYISGKPLPRDYPTDDAWFNKAWQPFIQYVTDGLRSSGYRVIGNCAGEYGTSDPHKQWQRGHVDGTIYEQWAVDWPQSGGGWLHGSRIEMRINAMATDPLEVWTADYGLETSDPEYDRKQIVGLAMYYIAVPLNQNNRSYNHAGTKKVMWEPIWDFGIGYPVELARKKADKYFWSRKYSEGMVLLNYEASGSVDYVLDRSYVDSTGKVYTGTVSVGHHSALILHNAN